MPLIQVGTTQLFVGTKFAYADGSWRYSGDYQSRFDENMSSLERWLIEGAATFQPSEHWEIVGDLTFQGWSLFV